MGRGLAEQLGAVDRKGRGFALDQRDIGVDVTGYIESDNKECVGRADCKGQGACRRSERERTCREKFPSGHRFFRDCEREMNARLIESMMLRSGTECWFVTLTFKVEISEKKAWEMLEGWFRSIWDAHCRMVNRMGITIERGQRFAWAVAQEWQKREVIHFHAILSGVRLGCLSRKRWEDRWSGMGGGFARVYEGRQNAAPYLAKYTGKTYHDSAIRWGGTWLRDAPPDSLRCCKA